MSNFNKEVQIAAYNYGNKTNSHSGDLAFIAGAESEIAKEHWQQGMYTEAQIKIIIPKYILWLYENSGPKFREGFDEWWKLNKKQNEQQVNSNENVKEKINRV